MEPIADFRIDIPEAALEDLRDRLRRTRWPAASPEPGWSPGVPVPYLQQLADHWLHRYDWRAHETALNAFPQGLTEIDGQRVHFLHVRSPEPDALPLVITHGWPGSVVEFTRILGPLTDPRAHGGDPADAFHVVAPSLPGFAFSTPLSAPAWDHARIAAAWLVLMDRLGYDRFGAHGGDTGSKVSPAIGRLAPDRVVGVHINGGLELPAAGDADLAALTPAERARLDGVRDLVRDGTGYADLQSTKPQTLAYALNDSPVGQLAWIADKFKDWTDPAADLPEDAVDVDQLLTNVTLYWLTGTGATSAHQYRAVRDEPVPERSEVPTGVAVFPNDPAVRPLLERRHRIVHWSEFDRGGHFAAMEAPDLLVQDLRDCFRPLRDRAGAR
ncbi:epoxide hydrolase 1 [Glycomyces sp. TRM65418]|uniref:epoxide hydrolase family protein n=1 Tax=Glycomyces sp. TRM65418 TaxID=2867006 RepID=UPI001CE67E1F|nr:epoxide hydrolase family protein [Glycomyces sp. TRM65418]MCC3761792.1 epoxide hydrolase 1 [Glycomyces sp. TRM65418]QZD55876.1 epoxide hydrolase 1 [Glycomyces sp. TRM65418]